MFNLDIEFLISGEMVQGFTFLYSDILKPTLFKTYNIDLPDVISYDKVDNGWECNFEIKGRKFKLKNKQMLINKNGKFKKIHDGFNKSKYIVTYTLE